MSIQLIEDRNDPNGVGMFSRVGRQTTNKNLIFLQKHLILYGVQSKKKQHKEVQPLDQLGNPLFVVKKDLKKKVVEPFLRIVSRQKQDEIFQKESVPSSGQYNPKFSSIDKNHKLVLDIKKSQPRKNISVDLSKSVLPPQNYYRSNTPTPLNLQTSRKQLKSSYDPHESRFEIQRISLTSSNTKRIKQIPDFDTTTNRSDFNYKEKEVFGQIYNVNYSLTQREPTKPLDFDKRTVRKDLTKISNCKNEEYYDYDYYTKSPQKISNIFAKTCGGTFSRSSTSKKNRYPIFMQKSVMTKAKLSQLNEQMLKENKYSQGAFINVKSSFAFTQPNKKQTVELDDLLKKV